MKKMVRNYAISAVAIIAFAFILVIYPQNSSRIIGYSADYLLEMVLILPAVVLLMGLFSVWASDKFISRYLGRHSGIRGALISVLLGSLPTGPLYVAFPLASVMLRKGASISNIVVFLGAWACLKIPQELVEMQFLGLEFMLMRWMLTVIFVMAMGVIMERVVKYPAHGLHPANAYKY